MLASRACPAGRKYIATQRFRTPSLPLAGEQEKTLLERLVIHPSSRPKLAFDLLVMTGIVYTAIVMPVKISLNLDFAEWLELAIDLIFIIDIGPQPNQLNRLLPLAASPCPLQITHRPRPRVRSSPILPRIL